MNLNICLAHAKNLSAEDSKLLKSLAGDYQGDGMSSSQAASRALSDVQKLAYTDRNETIADLSMKGGAVPPGDPVAFTPRSISESKSELAKRIGGTDATMTVADLKAIPGARGEREGLNIDNPGVMKAIVPLVKSIKTKGFDPKQPILVGVLPDGNKVVLDGNHRIEASFVAGVKELPVVEVDWTPADVDMRTPWTPGHSKFSARQKERVESEKLTGTGLGTKGFFSAVSLGLQGESSTGRKYEPVVSGVEKRINDKRTSLSKFRTEYKQHRGHFDDHIAYSIPGYYEVQLAVGNGIVKAFGKSHQTMLDVGASEGSFAKAITVQSDGNIETVALDPNPIMSDFFNEEEIPGSTYDMSAFGSAEDEGADAWKEGPTIVINKKTGETIPNPHAGEQIRVFDPQGKTFDIIHEAMTFQFISDSRNAQVVRLKELLSPDGVVIFEEKHTLADKAQEQVNEDQKDSAHKIKYFTQKEIDDKRRNILEGGEDEYEGMLGNQVRAEEMDVILGNHFKNVVQFWDSGNFKGYVASDNKGKVDAFVNEVGDISSEFDTVGTPRQVKNVQLSRRQSDEGNETAAGRSAFQGNEPINTPPIREDGTVELKSADVTDVVGVLIAIEVTVP